jgi:hypothetical protein
MTSWRWRFLVFLMKYSNFYLELHHFLVTHLREEHTPKVFCIGLGKTGTSSLYSALNTLGYRTVRLFKIGALMHAYPLGNSAQILIQQHWQPYIDEIKRHHYDAFTDFLLTMNRGGLYEALDQAFPGSKFILTIRDPESYTRSFRNYFSDAPWNSDTEIDLDQERLEFERYNRRVQDYFQDRPQQLLTIDIIAGDGWAPLCSFLDKPIPNKPFPRKNVGKKRQPNPNKT